MKKATRYRPELRERAIRLVREHRHEHPSEWAAIQWSAGKLGMRRETLRLWLRRDEVDQGRRPGVTSAERERIRDLEREVRELRRANEILKAASAFFARELDPRWPPRWSSSPRTRTAGGSSRTAACCRSRPAATTRPSGGPSRRAGNGTRSSRSRVGASGTSSGKCTAPIRSGRSSTARERRSLAA